MAAAATAPPPEPAKSRGIDYSKFDNIEDSDDEQPQASATASAGSGAKAAEKPHCHNCHKDISKPLRCGVCKAVEYCSAQCQKEDWRFHKRCCKKPEDPKAKSSASSPGASEDRDRETEERRRKEREERAAKKREEEKIVDNEENLTWYRHREWKPTAEPKKDFTPTQIADASSAASSGGDQSPPSRAGSAWNAAGTWEDKDVTAFAKSSLQESLSGFESIDVAGGALAAIEGGVEKVEGEASKPVIRGKQRHMFDLSFTLKFEFKWMDSSGQRRATGSVEVQDFTNDAFAAGDPTPPEIRLAFSEARLLDGGRKQAVEAAVGAGPWPPAPGTLMAQAAERMRAWVQVYQEAS